MPNKKKLKIKKSILFIHIILSSIFCITILEISLRIFTVQEVKRNLMYDKELGWRGIPNGNGTYVRLDDNIRADFHYNDYGFRDEDISSLSENATRVVLLGDSYVESMEVSYKNTFQKLVQKKLKSSYKNDIDVINVSSQGYGTAQEILAMRKFKNIIKPDVVVLVFFTGNDFDDNIRKRFAYLDTSGDLKIPQNKDSWFKTAYLTFQRWIYENSAIVFAVKNYITSHTDIKIGDAAKAAPVVDEQYQNKITKKLLVKLKNEVEKYAKFGVIIIPSPMEVEDQEYTRTAFVSELCKENNIPYLPLQSDLKRNYFFQYDWHFNNTGHQIVAEDIFRFLKANFILTTHKIRNEEEDINTKNPPVYARGSF